MISPPLRLLKIEPSPLRLVMPQFEGEVARSHGWSRWLATRVPGVRWLHLAGYGFAHVVVLPLVYLLARVLLTLLNRPLGIVALWLIGALIALVVVAHALTFVRALRVRTLDAEALVGVVGALAAGATIYGMRARGIWP